MMYFWKSIDVTGKIQDHHLILKEITIVLNDIGPEDVIQIVTDNGSNFKKACKLLDVKGIGVPLPLFTQSFAIG